jgi:hypothetical protein
MTESKINTIGPVLLQYITNYALIDVLVALIVFIGRRLKLLRRVYYNLSPLRLLSKE